MTNFITLPDGQRLDTDGFITQTGDGTLEFGKARNGITLRFEDGGYTSDGVDHWVFHADLGFNRALMFWWVGDHNDGMLSQSSVPAAAAAALKGYAWTMNDDGTYGLCSPCLWQERTTLDEALNVLIGKALFYPVEDMTDECID